MKRIAVLVAIVAVVATACGSDSPTSSAPPSTAADTTTEVSVPFANVTSPTTVPLSRDARLATGRCRDALGQFFASQIGPLGGGHKQLKAAEDLCDEAELQLKADNPATGSLASQLIAEIAGLNLALGFADLKLLSDKFDVEAQHTLQDAVDKFDANVDDLLDS